MKTAQYREETKEKRQKLRVGHGHRKKGSRETKCNRSKEERIGGDTVQRAGGGARKGRQFAARRRCC